MCAIDLFSKHAWVVPMKNKKGLVLLIYFKNNLRRKKPNKIWAEIYSTYNEGTSVLDERFIRTLKNKISKKIVAISKKIILMC